MLTDRIDRILAILDVGLQSTTLEHHGMTREQFPFDWVATSEGSFTFGPVNYTGLTVIGHDSIVIYPDQRDSLTSVTEP